jgi:hypothetical protein
VLLTDCNRIFFNSNFIAGASAGTSISGVQLITSDLCTFTGNSIESSIGGGTAYGVDIGASCDRNVVVANHLNGSTTDTLDNGANSEIANNS